MAEESDEKEDVDTLLKKLLNNQQIINSNIIYITEQVKQIKKQVDAGIRNDIKTGDDFESVQKKLDLLINK